MVTALHAHTIAEVETLCSCTIREVEACCTAVVSEAETCHVACVKEAEANCTSTLADAEDCCSTAIREAESQGASQAHQIQQSHTMDMQCLEVGAIDKERIDCLNLPCSLWFCPRSQPPRPTEYWWPPSVFYWEMLQHLPCSAFLQGYLPPNWSLLFKLLLPLLPEYLSPHLGPTGDTTHLTGESPFPHQGPPSKQLWMSPPFQAEGGDAPP